MEQLDPRMILKRSRPADGRPQPDCPDDQVLTAALDGEYREIEKDAFEAHVSDCDHCLARLGRVARLNRVSPDAGIPDLTRIRAERLVRPSFKLPKVPVAAAAALAGFAVLLTASWFAPSPPVSKPENWPAPEVRNIDPDAFRPQIVFPEDGAFLESDHPLFQWRPVPGTLHYDVRIVSGDGALLWREQVPEPQWQLPGHLRLAAGEDYYFRVDAYLTQAKSLSSRHVMFRVNGHE